MASNSDKVTVSAGGDPKSDHDGLFEGVSSVLDFPAEEGEILAFWKREGVFAKTLQAETRCTGPSKGSFIFYEGPPTANGMPHNGHVLTRAVKDVVPRYKTMCGYDVPRKAGWDTHGLPVEVEVEKSLSIHGKAAIEEYGIRPFIEKCIGSVFRYTEAWEENTEKIGYWIDTKDAYVTYHRSYVESVWWALSELYKKGLLYRGHRVCWFWPQGGTALSAAEVGWNYKTVDDPSAYVAYQLVDDEDVFLCVWTTTPWTLPSNGYAAVRSKYDYVEVEWKDGKRLIVAEALREGLAKKFDLELTVVRSFKGSELVGKRYRPCFDSYSRTLFDRVAKLKEGGTAPWYWRVLDADFVTLEAGTGIVHLAPAFGEDDNVAHKAELKRYIDALDVELICGVHPDGTLTEEIEGFAGLWVKDADPKILAHLTESGALVHHETYRHDYPFCWRADSDPLIQLARPAWYIRTTERIDRAIANNQAVTWLPSHIKDGRFGDFLDNNVDWALSRERFWGTPLNVWACDGCELEFVPPSVDAIEARNPKAFDHFRAAQANDPTLNPHLIVHKPWVDDVVIPCDQCSGTMRRVPEVIDAWFDSGSMPFAQLGFPHAEGSVDAFQRRWPADFISEAIDQTRGWFYSLLMVSTLLFDDETCKSLGMQPAPYPHPYRSCVVLGHVCDRDGKKESKSKGNYTPPDIILSRVRMEFAPIDGSVLSETLKKAQAKVAPGEALIAREDYEGLDLTGQSSEVVLYRGVTDAEPKAFTLRQQKGLGRRVVLLHASDREALGLEFHPDGAEVKPVEVPKADPTQRVFIEDPSRPAPGADAFRWFFYAASPPWNNTRHSLTNVRLTQKDFLIKLRNVYSFFVIYSNIDGFNPADGNTAASGLDSVALTTSSGYRPVADRHLLDRWLMSELSLTVAEVRARLDEFDLYAAAQRIVELVDGLSNWYVRRSRSRFWSSVGDPDRQRDKLDASFTLYETLVTIAKLVAPFVPFFSERLYQNLVRKPWPTSQALSVHLASYPEPVAAHVDDALAEEMAAVRELVSLGLQVRTENKLRVRQPLSRVDVVVANAGLRGRLEQHVALVKEELNVHEVRWLKPGEEGAAVAYQLKPNFRALGPRMGKRVQAVKKALTTIDPAAARGEFASTGEITLAMSDGDDVVLTGDEVQITVVASDGFAAAGGRVGVVVLHTALDDALRQEGLAREVLAKIQNRRKKMGLGYTERIAVTLEVASAVADVVTRFSDHIKKESLCDQLDLVGEHNPSEGHEGDEWIEEKVQGEQFWLKVVSSAATA